MRSRHSHARLIVVSSFALLVCLASAQRAVADPCTVDISFVRAVANTHEYALEFGSTVDGVADLRWTMYAGDRAYTARFATTTFTAPIPASPRAIERWHSAPTYVRLPDDAPAVSAATVELIDPDAKTPIACSGGRMYFGAQTGYLDDPDAENDAAERATRVEAQRALDGAASATPTTLQATASAPLTCAEPFRPASVNKPFQASYPLAAQFARVTGKTFVLVEVAPAGDVAGAFVVGTSGSRDLDEAARAAAEKTTYRAERFRCDAVAGSYLFQVDFTGR